eukprot:365445-Chlamydomonas_euryale.AAC.8
MHPSQESLGGNAKTTLIVCVADAAVHADETLQLATRLELALRLCRSLKIVLEFGMPLTLRPLH